MDPHRLSDAGAARRKLLDELLSVYFQAWQTRSVELLERVFAPCADYYEKPFQPPLRGLEAIKGYWREKVLPQRDIHIRVLRVGYGDAEAFAEWEASFLLEGCRVQVSGMLVLTVDLAARHVTALRECFRSRERQE